MPTLTIVDGDGNTVEQELITRTVTFISGDDDEFDPTEGEAEFRPAIVNRVEYDHEGAMASVTSVCGETENRRASDEKPKITVEGIVTESQLENVYALKNLRELTMISDLKTEQVEVKRVTVEQNTEIVEMETNGIRELAFPFQLQLRVP